MPRLYREAPVNSIWEGSGNIMCLDVLRALERTPSAADVLRHELGEAKNARIKASAERIEKRLAARDHADESQARALVRDLIVALQGSLLVRHAPSNVSDAFCVSRLDGEGVSAFGLLPRGLDTRGIAERADPAN
jgi:putative acyl-CoA dehydrogenase